MYDLVHWALAPLVWITSSSSDIPQKCAIVFKKERLHSGPFSCLRLGYRLACSVLPQKCAIDNQERLHLEPFFMICPRQPNHLQGASGAFRAERSGANVREHTSCRYQAVHHVASCDTSCCMPSNALGLQFLYQFLHPKWYVLGGADAGLFLGVLLVDGVAAEDEFAG